MLFSDETGIIAMGIEAFNTTTGVKGFSFAIPFRYDNVLWNKQANSTLTDLDSVDPDPILRVYLQKVEDDVAQTVDGSYFALDSVTTGEAIPDAHALNYTDAAGKVVSSDPNVAFGSYTSLELSHFTNSFYKDLNFYDDLVIKLTLPSATVNGDVVYMQADFEKLYVSDGTADYETEIVDHTITIRMGRSLFTNNGLAKIRFTFADTPDLSAITDVIHFRGRIQVFISGTPLVDQAVGIQLNNNPDPILTAKTAEGLASTHAMDIVQFMGMYGIDNAGGIKNTGVRIKMAFDTKNTNAVGITTVRLLRASGNPNKAITVTYTLVDKDGNLYQDGQAFTLTISDVTAATTSDNNTNTLLNRSRLPQEQREYYFKTIEYDLPIVRASSNYYARSASKSYSGTGTFWGYVLQNQTSPSGKILHSITVTDPDTGYTPISNLCVTTLSTAIDAAQTPLLRHGQRSCFRHLH